VPKLVDTGHYLKQDLEQDLQDLKDLYRDAALGPSTEAIIKEAETKGALDPGVAMIQLATASAKRMRTMSPQTSILGVELACDKEDQNASLLMLECRCQKHGHQPTWTSSEAMEASAILSCSPLDGNHGGHHH